LTRREISLSSKRFSPLHYKKNRDHFTMDHDDSESEAELEFNISGHFEDASCWNEEAYSTPATDNDLGHVGSYWGPESYVILGPGGTGSNDAPCDGHIERH
jgi:hypothetical protein